MFHSTDSAPSRLRVNLAAIANNIRALRAIIGPQRKLIAVVKADGYGHGAVEVARAAQEAGADMLGVACLDEAAELRKAGSTLPILIMGLAPPEAGAAARSLDCEVMVADLDTAKALSATAPRAGQRLPVHVKVNSGMGRLGIPAEQVAEVASELARLPGLQVVGVCSQFATAEHTDTAFARSQLARFQQAAHDAELRAGRILLKHIANSGACLYLPEALLDAVRPGLLVYGLAPRYPELAAGFQPALSWTTRIVQIRVAEPGETIGYGRTHAVRNETRVAALPVGYADGLARALSNKAEVLLHGLRCPVVGAISMDTTMIDIGRVPQAQVGDETVLIGRQGNDEIRAEELAQRAGTIVYETLSRLGRRPLRQYVRGESL